MSQFNEYAQRAKRVAKETFAKREELDNKLKAARDSVRKYPKRTGFGVTPDYMANSAKAEASLLEAQQNMRNFEINTVEESKRRLAKIREELAEEIAKYYQADPHEVDEKTLELLRSGILSVDEYEALYEDANNTMKRIIGTYAIKEAENHRDHRGSFDNIGGRLAVIHNKSLTATGGEYLKAYDLIAEVANRCFTNPFMISAWDELVGETVESF